MDGSNSRPGGRPARARAVTLAAIAALALASCGLALPGTPAPTLLPTAIVPQQTSGPVDRALEAFDAAGVLGGVKDGAACKPGTLTGSHGGKGRLHALADFVCPRIGDDRTVLFAFTGALEAALRATGAGMDASGATLNDSGDPLAMEWDVRGETMVGTVRVLGVNGPSTLVLYVSLDLVTR